MILCDICWILKILVAIKDYLGGLYDCGEGVY